MSDAAARTPRPEPGPPAAHAAVDAWKRALLDLTKRNRALSFRPTRVSTVTVVDEHPAEAFRQLVLRERAMRFRAAPERPTAAGTAGDAAPPADEDAAHDGAADDEVDAPTPDFVPYDAAALDERHTDEWLQTALVPDALDRALRRLDEQARLAIGEQGVNTLFLALGMLHYVESADSAQPLRAPLVLVPVELTRRSARAGYGLRATDDDPIVNPALAEWLRRSHAVSLPELPDVGTLEEGYDLQSFLAAAAQAIAGREGWAVKSEIVLALFSFQKLVMYKDLEANADAVAGHRLVRRLVTRAAAEDDGATHVVGLPDDVRRMDLDADFPPERTFQVVDADSSQLRAIAAVARGHDVVIEGPPGTGKSQTITNVIAQALAAGQSVLFVAEKMAALSVVHDRLARAGLAEFCLELHSTKASKRAVVRSVAAALDASLQPVAPVPAATGERLAAVRATLTGYADAVHEPHGALGASPFEAYGEYGRVRDAPRVAYDGPVDVARERLDEAERDLRDLGVAGAAVGVPARHPWRDGTRTFYAADDVDAAAALARDVAARVADVRARAERVEQALGLPAARTLAEVDATAAAAALLHRSPGAPLAVLASDAWNAAPPEALRLVERGRAAAALRDRLLARLTPDALERDHAADAEHVERRAEGLLSFLAFLDGRWRATRARWLAYRTPGWDASLVEQAALMREVDRLRAEEAALATAEGEARALFGALWQGERSDWDALARYVAWVVEVRALAVRHALADRALVLASRPAPDVTDARALADAARDAAAALDRLRAAVGWPAGYLSGEPLGEVEARAAALAAAAGEAQRWATFERARQAVERGIARGVLPAVLSGELAAEAAAPAFLRAFWLAWLRDAVASRPALERFATLTHEERVREFRALDQRAVVENRASLVARLRERVQRRLREPDAAAALPALRREMARQRGHAPLRRTLRDAGAAVRAIKPCWMMSPLSVAQYLPGGAPTFDLVIFDEASQLPPEDAVGAVSRGARLVVVGDPKQLPPTNFFAASIGQAEVPRDEEGTPLYEDAESVLEEFMGSGVPMTRLRWHYRSAHESLITFSNVSFYDADLHTFPSVEADTDAAGLAFRFVEGGVYEGKGLNLVEARRVADEVAAFARAQLAREARGEPAESLGVGTFNLRQQLAIQDELEQRRRDDPSLEPFFDRARAEPFFVKNLENIQGDERDVVFLSVTYARGRDGRLRHNFGPLNGENGWRRLNVLTTRARRRMLVFASMRGDDIAVAPATSRGAGLLRDFLRYAEHGRLDGVAAGVAADAGSPFERDVMGELTARGLTVVPQVGASGYRVDLGVVDDAAPGRFLCGIECDGAAYHASETARDRDRLRQQVLEARGWTIHRVWSTDWFKDRAGQVERLLGLIAATRAARGIVRQSPEPAADDALPRVAADAPDAAPGEALDDAPRGAEYETTPGEGRHAGEELLDAPPARVRDAVREVVATEAPIHEADLVSRVAAMWGTRAGARIEARILEACAALEREGAVRRRGEFLWDESDVVVPRSRAGTRIPAERIAPEEYAAAVRAVLAGGRAAPRGELVAEVRAMLGFARTGPVLDVAIGGAVDALLAAGELGEASGGLRLRSG